MSVAQATRRLYLPLGEPLRELRAASGLSHLALGKRLTKPLSDAAVVKAEGKGPDLELGKLAEYARAAGWQLRAVARDVDPLASDRVSEVTDFTLTVAEARGFLAAFGLTLQLELEQLDPAELAVGKAVTRSSRLKSRRTRRGST
jgi:hypothetical protein